METEIWVALIVLAGTALNAWVTYKTSKKGAKVELDKLSKAFTHESDSDSRRREHAALLNWQTHQLGYLDRKIEPLESLITEFESFVTDYETEAHYAYPAILRAIEQATLHLGQQVPEIDQFRMEVQSSVTQEKLGAAPAMGGVIPPFGRARVALKDVILKANSVIDEAREQILTRKHAI